MTSILTAGNDVPTFQPTIHHLEYVMGTVVTIDVYTTDGEYGPEVSLGLARARAILRRADAVFSTWKAGSPMSRLRRGETTSGESPAEVAEVLELCAVAREISDGWFDPWAMPGGVDPTGYVKGWAAERALAALTSPEISGAMVNAAGDIASFGGPEPLTPFRIGIVDPFSPGDLGCVVELTGALATSGRYERGNHLIDPRSGRPTASVASASVSGPDLGLADALATALAVAGEPVMDVIDALNGYEAFVVSLAGTWRWTDGFPFASPGPWTSDGSRRFRSSAEPT
jgi:thiamine biosynthesis lipoprotein